MAWNPSDAQVLALVLCPKFTAIASVVGSSLIIRDVKLLRKNKSDDFSTRHSLLAGMSVCDIISSSAWFLTSWPVPEDMPRGVWTVWNIGNRQTCAAQGFFIHLAIGTVIYNACLALYYLLVIRYGWKNEYITKHVEPWMHFVAIGFALGTGIAGLALDLFNPFGYSCAITAYPPFCTQSYENKGPTNCIRGDNARIYQAAFWLGPACSITAFLAVSMFLVYWKIRTIERGSSHFQSQPGRMQQRFALQAFLYVGAMFITWGPLIGLIILRQIANKPPNWWIFFWPLFILPAQGFFNSLIYFHSRTTKQPRRNATTERMTRSSSFVLVPSLLQWGSVQCLFSRRRCTASADTLAAVIARVTPEVESQDLEGADPLAVVVARVTQGQESEDPQNEDPVMERVDRNGATGGSWIFSGPVGMELSTICSN